ncbi:MAG: MATE family efflux transporter [Lachnospiraceae bacterium]|nr:MATE family efflux transporter [Lachnospiraceae bacterium]MCI9657708.1 MATE family efflux transporter [Lachnospiraceae bacterium]
MEERNNFGKGSVAGNIMSMAVPMTVAQILNLLYNLVDRIYIGHIPGADSLALTGVGLTFPIVSMITAFAGLFGMGGAPLCSIERGKGNQERAEAIMQNAFWMLAGTGVLIMIAGYAAERPLLYALGGSDATYVYASEYLKIYLAGTLAVMIGLGLNPFINAQGFGKTGMVTVALGALINLVLDPLFIFVLHMGVKGAALATVMAQCCSAVWVLFFLTGEKPLLRLKLRFGRPDWKIVGQITALGTSNFIMNFTNSVVQVVCNRQLQFYGGDLYVGIMTVLNSVREVLTMVVIGMSNGAQPVISFNYGAGKKDRVRQGIRFMTAASIIYTCAAWAVTLAFPKFFIHMFNSEPELLAAGVPAMHIYFFGFCFMALQFSGQTTFQALGQAKYAITFSLFRKIVIVVPLTLLLPLLPGIGLHGVFLAEPISNLIGGCACFFTMLRVIWRGKLKE